MLYGAPVLRDLPPEKRVEAELKFLSEAGETLASSLDYATTMRNLTRLAVPRLADWCIVDVLEGEQLLRVGIHHADPAKIALAVDFNRRWPPLREQAGGVWEVIKTGKPLLVQSLPLEQLTAMVENEEQVAYLRDLRIHSWILAPLIVNGEALGCLTLAQAETSRHFDAEDVTFVMDVARRAAVHVQNSRLYRGAKQQREALATINRVGSAIAAELDLDKLVQLVTDAGTELSGAEFGAFFYNVLDERGESFMLYSISGVPREAFEKFPMPRNTAIFAPTFEGKGVVRMPDVTKDARYGHNVPHNGMPEGHLPVRSYLAVPVISRSGEVIGGLFFGHSKPALFTAQSEEVVSGLASQAAIAVDNARLFSKANNLIAELGRANQELDQFAHVASHDLKAPLRGIASLTQFLEDDGGEQLPESAKQHVGAIRDRVRRMERLIQGILEFSRSGRDEAKSEWVNVGTLLRGVVELLPDGGKVALPASMPTVRTVRVHLEQVFLNLISNALKHGKQASDSRVDVAWEEREQFYEFSVRDRGEGIAPEFHERIFNIFQTLDPRNPENSGIGLAVVRRLVDFRGGRVWVESTPGEGATFKFTWPKNERTARRAEATPRRAAQVVTADLGGDVGPAKDSAQQK